MDMKKHKQYYISVEGETEKWYFEHLRKLINAAADAKYKVKLETKIQKSPLKYAKTIASLDKVDCIHVCDHESNDEVHAEQFMQILNELKKVKREKGSVLYKLGYSNYAFDLWLILHKLQCLTSFIDRKHYIKDINKAYGKNFQFMNDYKEEKAFRGILSQIEINDVKQAIINSNEIRKCHEENGHVLSEYCGFKYYKENPDLTINKCVEDILKACGLL